MIKRVTQAVAWVVAVGLVSVSAAAPVRDVRIENRGPGALDENMVRAQLSVKAGDELDRGSISRDVKALLATKLFSDVQAAVDGRDDGPVVRYTLSPRLRLVKPVSVTGGDVLGERKVRKLLAIETGDLVDDASVAAGVQKVSQEYRDRYYPNVEITWSFEDLDRSAGTTGLRVEITAGRRAKIRKAYFVGNTAVSRNALRAAMDLPRWYNPISWFASRAYDPDRVFVGYENIKELYQKKGYLDVSVGEAEIRPIGKGRIALTVPIREGPQYRVGEIRFAGVSLYPEDDLRRQLRLHTNSVASSEDMEASGQAVRDYYGSRGYIHTSVDPVPAARSDEGVADVTLHVTEGRLTHIRNIEFAGNSRTKDKVIRREVQVFPGEIYDEVKVRRSERLLKNLGYFSDVRSYDRDTTVPGQSDLVMELEEQKSGQFMAGAGFSSVDNLIGFVELSQGNFDLLGWPYFVGGGQKLRLRAQFGSKREDYLISFVEPWFLDRKLSLGLDLYSSRRAYSGYDTSRQGGSVNLGKPLGGPNRLDVRYTLERVRILNVSDTNEYLTADGDPYYFTTQEDRIESSLRLTVTHDTRDSAFIPSRGTHALASTMLAGGPLGFDTDLYGFRARAAQYVPLWFKHVFSIEAMAENIDAYGDTDEVPLADRLFIGGARTVRGFKYRDMGPKVTRTVVNTDGTTSLYHKPIGGRSLAMASAEYYIPVVQYLRLVGFYDIGNVWEDPYEFDLGTMGAGAGVGIRFDIPGFPIRLDYAWPVMRDDDLTRTDRWAFSIGFDF